MDGKHKEGKTEARDILIFVITSLSLLLLALILICKMFPFVGKAAEAWSWQLTLVKCRDLQCMQRRLHFFYSLRNMAGFTFTLRAPGRTGIYKARVLQGRLFWLVLGRCSVRLLVEMPTVVTDNLCSFHQSLQANAGMVPQVSQLTLPFSSCTIH